MRFPPCSNPNGELWTARVNSRPSFSMGHVLLKGPFPPTFYFPSPHLPSAAHSTQAHLTLTSDFIPKYSGLLATLDGAEMEILMCFSHPCFCLFTSKSPSISYASICLDGERVGYAGAWSHTTHSPRKSTPCPDSSSRGESMKGPLHSEPAPQDI